MKIPPQPLRAHSLCTGLSSMSGLLQFMQHFMEHTMGQESASMELEEVLKNLAVVMFKNLSPKWVEHVLSCLELAHSKAAANSSSAIMDPNLKDFFDGFEDLVSFLAARANYMWALLPELLGGADRVTTTDYGFTLYTLNNEQNCKDMIMDRDKYITNQDTNAV